MNPSVQTLHLTGLGRFKRILFVALVDAIVETLGGRATTLPPLVGLKRQNITNDDNN